jgi:hypothetical protein
VATTTDAAPRLLPENTRREATPTRRAVAFTLGMTALTFGIVRCVGVTGSRVGRSQPPVYRALAAALAPPELSPITQNA